MNTYTFTVCGTLAAPSADYAHDILADAVPNLPGVEDCDIALASDTPAITRMLAVVEMPTMPPADDADKATARQILADAVKRTVRELLRPDRAHPCRDWAAMLYTVSDALYAGLDHAQRMAAAAEAAYAEI